MLADSRWCSRLRCFQVSVLRYSMRNKSWRRQSTIRWGCRARLNVMNGLKWTVVFCACVLNAPENYSTQRSTMPHHHARYICYLALLGLYWSPNRVAMCYTPYRSRFQYSQSRLVKTKKWIAWSQGLLTKCITAFGHVRSKGTSNSTTHCRVYSQLSPNHHRPKHSTMTSRTGVSTLVIGMFLTGCANSLL